MTSAVLSAAAGWLLYASLVATLGGVVARWLIVPRSAIAGTNEAAELERTAARLALVGALLLPLALGLLFLHQLVAFHDPFATWTGDARLLLSTAWGHTWMRGIAGAGVALLAFALAVRDSVVAFGFGTVAVLALGTFPAFTGHAASSGDLRAVTLAADTLHVLAAGCWIGGLTFVLLSERGQDRLWDGAGVSRLPALVPAFSPVALSCVSILVLTGAFATWMHVPSVSALFGTAYGRTLVVKLLLVAGAFGLGFLNWRRLTPRLGSDEGPSALRRAAGLELLVAQTVLLVTAVLVRTPPPG